MNGLMEKLLQHIWKHRILPLPPLRTTDGAELDVLDAGLQNQHAGPDFFNAKVRIGHTVWAGNVEVHLKSSDWYRHGHDRDEAYNNVILHVASVVDCPVTTASGKSLPQFQLDIPANLYAGYEELIKTEEYPRCYRLIPRISAFTAHSWMDTMLSERLQERSSTIMAWLEQSGGDWERALFTTLARSFGFGLNSDAFEAWAKLIPLDKIAKHRDELFQIEAIFLGTAGLLPDAESADEYGQKLVKEYAYQRHLFSLPEPMRKAQWKYLRLRPQNFPHIRLAELAWMYYNRQVGMSVLLDCLKAADPLRALYDMFSASTSDYWNTHIMMGRRVGNRKLTLSRASKQLLIVNTAVPVLFTHANCRGDEALKERLYDIMHSLPAENNRILRIWKECGLDVGTAADSQALIQLKRRYCDRSDCLRCRFGYEYLKERI